MHSLDPCVSLSHQSPQVCRPERPPQAFTLIHITRTQRHFRRTGAYFLPSPTTPISHPALLTTSPHLTQFPCPPAALTPLTCYEKLSHNPKSTLPTPETTHSQLPGTCDFRFSRAHVSGGGWRTRTTLYFPPCTFSAAIIGVHGCMSLSDTWPRHVVPVFA